MRANNAMHNAIKEFITVAYSVDFDTASIAGSIVDSVYDIDPDMCEEVRYTMLPMVKEFHHSRSLRNEELVEDWKKAIFEWEQLQMWKTLGAQHGRN